MKKPFMIVVWMMVLLLTVSINLYGQSKNEQSPTQIVEVFSGNDIHFLADSLTKYQTENIFSADNGRMIYTTVDLPVYSSQIRISAHVALHPIPIDEITVGDKWDRAGNIRLARDDMPDIEIVKFITSYGGFTEYDVDVSHLAPLLSGECTFKGFIDTWVSPAWKIDFSLTFESIIDSSDSDIYLDYIHNPNWVRGIVFIESFNASDMGKDGIEVEINIPADMRRVVMNYFVSGHCTDGNGADEFVPKDNVIYVDGQPVIRFLPWRDDCKQFRSINPYTRRWSDGYWSSDYSRSGWCPGDKVDPVQIDLSDYLTPGNHTIRFVIEDMRPEDENGNFGYWRVSSHLLGWNKMVKTVKW